MREGWPVNKEAGLGSLAHHSVGQAAGIKPDSLWVPLRLSGSEGCEVSNIKSKGRTGKSGSLADVTCGHLPDVYCLPWYLSGATIDHVPSFCATPAPGLTRVNDQVMAPKGFRHVSLAAARSFDIGATSPAPSVSRAAPSRR